MFFWLPGPAIDTIQPARGTKSSIEVETRALANALFHDPWVSSAAVDPRRSDIHAFRRMRCPLAWFGRRAPVRGSVSPGDVDTDRLDGRPDRRESGTAKVSTRRPRCPHDARFACTLTAWWLEKMTDGSCTVPMIVIRISSSWLLAQVEEQGLLPSQHALPFLPKDCRFQDTECLVHPFNA